MSGVPNPPPHAGEVLSEAKRRGKVLAMFTPPSVSCCALDSARAREGA
jgi:hypothetical protein